MIGMADLDVAARRRLAVFLGILIILVAGFSVGSWRFRLDLLALGPIYMFTPLLAAAIVCRGDNISLRDVGCRLGKRRWLIVSAVIWPPIALTIAGISILIPGIRFDSSIIVSETGVPNEPLWLLTGLIGLILALVVIGMTVNAVFALGEEFGWRGYLLWELAPLGFWKASFLIGTIWGLWHAPLVLAGLNYPSFPLVGVFIFTLVCIVISPIFTYLVVRGESVLPAVFFHGVFNAAGLTVLAGTSDPVLRVLVASEGGVVGLLVFALISILIWRVGTPKMANPFADRSIDLGSERTSVGALSKQTD